MARNPDLLSTPEAAALFGVHPATVNRWASERLIPFVEFPSGGRRYRRCDIEAAIERMERPVEQASGE